MKFSFRDKIFRTLVIVLVLVAAAAIVLFATGTIGSGAKKLSEYDGIPVVGASSEGRFLQDVYFGGGNSDWKELGDVDKVDRAIERRIKSAAKALGSENIDKAMKYFREDKREEYAAFFNANPEAADKAADYLDGLVMTYLTEKPARETTFYRTAEYSGESGNGTPVVFILIDGDWYIDSL